MTLEIHRVLLERFGGPPGIRDTGLLESVLCRPQTGQYAELAPAMWASLMMIPPLLAGNKPVAFFATEVFVRLNGYKLNVRAEEAHRFLISLLEQHRCTFAELLPWIRTHAVQL